MASDFVTSFAASENSTYAARFHLDLVREVTRQARRPVTAHECSKAVPPEERCLLVAGTGVLVVLWSSDYFGDPGCLGDWNLFIRRLDRVPVQRREALRRSTRVLVRWRTTDTPLRDVPRPRMFDGDVTADCNRHGLYKVVRDQSPTSPSSGYLSALREVAGQVRAGLAARLPVLALDDMSRPAPVLPGPRPMSPVSPPPAVPRSAPLGGSTVTLPAELGPAVARPARPPAPGSAPRVLISYAHDPRDPGHADEVKALSELLKAGGVDVRLDQDVNDEPQHWRRWMTTELKYADRILMVASPAYRRRVEGREKPGTGRGATWEGEYLLDYAYDNSGTWEKRILRVVFPRFRDDDLPEFPGSASVTVYRVDPVTGDGDLDRLLGYLTKGRATTR
ncbi:TIR domain-containing protein [Streptomyces sp. YIM S03343]